MGLSVFEMLLAMTLYSAPAPALPLFAGIMLTLAENAQNVVTKESIFHHSHGRKTKRARS